MLMSECSEVRMKLHGCLSRFVYLCRLRKVEKGCKVSMDI